MSESHSGLRIKKGLCCVNQSVNQTETSDAPWWPVVLQVSKCQPDYFKGACLSCLFLCSGVIIYLKCTFPKQGASYISRSIVGVNNSQQGSYWRSADQGNNDLNNKYLFLKHILQRGIKQDPVSCSWGLDLFKAIWSIMLRAKRANGNLSQWRDHGCDIDGGSSPATEAEGSPPQPEHFLKSLTPKKGFGFGREINADLLVCKDKLDIVLTLL